MEVRVAAAGDKGDLFDILLDEEVWRTVHAKIFGKDPRQKIEPLGNGEDFQEAFAALEASLGRRYALKQLAMRSFSSLCLQKKMEKLLVSKKVIEKVIGEMTACGYLDDAAWGEAKVMAFKRRHYGRRLIEYKLKGKGASSASIAKWSSSYDGEAATKEVLFLLENRYRSRDLSSFKERNKVVVALMRRGFDRGEIEEGLRRLSAGKGS